MEDKYKQQALKKQEDEIAAIDRSCRDGGGSAGEGQAAAAGAGGGRRQDSLEYALQLSLAESQSLGHAPPPQQQQQQQQQQQDSHPPVDEAVASAISSFNRRLSGIGSQHSPTRRASADQPAANTGMGRSHGEGKHGVGGTGPKAVGGGAARTQVVGSQGMRRCSAGAARVELA